MEGVSPKDVDILKSLDSKSLEIFRSIAKGNVGNEGLKKEDSPRSSIILG